MNTSRSMYARTLGIALVTLGTLLAACGGESVESEEGTEDATSEVVDTRDEALMPAGGGDCCNITCSQGSCSVCGYTKDRPPSCTCEGGRPNCSN